MYDIVYDHIHTFRPSNMAIEIPKLGKGISHCHVWLLEGIWSYLIFDATAGHPPTQM